MCPALFLLNLCSIVKDLASSHNSFMLYPCKDPDLMLLCICGDVTSAFT